MARKNLYIPVNTQLLVVISTGSKQSKIGILPTMIIATHNSIFTQEVILPVVSLV